MLSNLLPITNNNKSHQSNSFLSDDIDGSIDLLFFPIHCQHRGITVMSSASCFPILLLHQVSLRAIKSIFD
ncbi:hypothetical protein DERP_006565 [Dermatophagoides pteronyssinus]|uniref:Uncharacterized protein n=1 Tax=Dermatophagoides pteronyssinus TaxID=6956 RepID=A0ABQ8IQR3_DERPT|nr:hypothetical protein DERP_006565 [Dermatophagoides pteronyssinus]